MPPGQSRVEPFDAHHPYALMSILLFVDLLKFKVAEECRHEFVDAEQRDMFADTSPRPGAELEHRRSHTSELVC